MVHVKDEGEFDAPIDRIWKFLQDNSVGAHNHKAVKSVKTIAQEGKSVTQEVELYNPDGTSTHLETWKLTFNPPHGFEMEVVAGPTKGTKYTHRYTSMGSRTRVEVEGEFQVQGMDDAAIRKMALSMLAMVFDEDRSSLAHYT